MKSTGRLYMLALVFVVSPLTFEQGTPVMAVEGKSPTTAEIGKPAPDFTLKDVAGKEHKLSSYKGKVVVLEWINHECPISNGHYKRKTMQKTLGIFKDKGVVWLAIDSSHFAEEKADAIGKWWQEQGTPFAYLMDASGTVGKMYGAKTTPHLFVIDAKGVLAYSGAIDGAYGAKDNATNYVEAAVRALLEGSTVAQAKTKPYGCSVKYKG